MDITNVIDRLDALVNTSRKMPATRSRLVDAEKVMELVEQLRLSIPQDIRAAHEVIEKKDNIINQAHIDARRTRGEAEEEFRLRVDQSDILSAARSNAEGLMADAERKVSRMVEQAEVESSKHRAEADAYIVQTLRNLERELTTVLTTVRKGLNNLGATVQV